MIIKKHIPLATLEVDTKNGKLELSSPQFELRIKELKFEKISEKFSDIEVSGGKVIMVKEGKVDESVEDLASFVVSVIQMVFWHLQKKKITLTKRRHFYKKLLIGIRELIDKEE